MPGTPGVNPGTIGTAFDVLIGLRYQPNTIPTVARPYARWNPEFADGWANILNLVAEDQTSISRRVGLCPRRRGNRSPILPYDLEDLLDEQGYCNEYDLLAIATAEAVEELANLEELAGTNLYPHLGEPPAPDLTIDPDRRRVAAWTDATPNPGGPVSRFGPTFTASVLCQADADLIHDGTLYEFKTRLGKKDPDGIRTDTLPLIDLYQALGYVLFDTNDDYGIRRVAVYSEGTDASPLGLSAIYLRLSPDAPSISLSNEPTSGQCSAETRSGSLQAERDHGLLVFLGGDDVVR